MKNFLTSKAAKFAGVVGVVGASVLAFAGVSGAATFMPSTDLPTLATTATNTAAPILIAVVVALIPLLIVFLVIRWVRGLFGHR